MDLRGLLAAIGGGAESLGSDIGRRDELGVSRRRQTALDALQKLVEYQKLGLSDVPDGQDPNALASQKNDYNDMVSGAGAAIPNSAAGLPETFGPSQFGKARTMQLPGPDGTLRTVIQDPSQTPEALAERRAQSGQQAALSKQQSEDAAKAKLEQDKETARATAAARAAQADYTTLQSLDAKHPLATAPFNPDYAGSYAREVGAAHQRQTAKDAYHAPVSEWVETPSVGPNGRVVIMNKVTGERKEADIGAPKPAAGGANSQGALTSLPDLLRTHDALTHDENDPQFEMTRAAQATEGGNYGISHAFVKGTSPGVGNIVAAAAGQVMGGASDRQTNYLKNGRAWGEDISQAWKGRTNEERVLRDIATGTVDPSTTHNPVVKASLQTRRENGIAMTAIANPQQLTSMTPADQARVQQMIQRLTPEQIAQAKQAAQANPQAQQNGVGQGKPVSPDDAQHAQRDPKFAAWLKSQGYQVP